MCVYDMLNEPCKKHKDWGNCQVSVSDIGTETASSSARYWSVMEAETKTVVLLY